MHASLLPPPSPPGRHDPHASPSDNLAGSLSACPSDDPNANLVINLLLLPVTIPMLLLLADAAAAAAS